MMGLDGVDLVMYWRKRRAHCNIMVALNSFLLGAAWSIGCEHWEDAKECLGEVLRSFDLEAGEKEESLTNDILAK